MNPAVDKAIADALPHDRRCPAAWSHISGVTRCTCGTDGKRAVLMARVTLATNNGRVYLR